MGEVHCFCCQKMNSRSCLSGGNSNFPHSFGAQQLLAILCSLKNVIMCKHALKAEDTLHLPHVSVMVTDAPRIRICGCCLIKHVTDCVSHWWVSLDTFPILVDAWSHKVWVVLLFFVVGETRGNSFNVSPVENSAQWPGAWFTVGTSQHERVESVRGVPVQMGLVV